MVVLPCSWASWSSVNDEDLFDELSRSHVTETIIAAAPNANRNRNPIRYMLEKSFSRSIKVFLRRGPDVPPEDGCAGGVEGVLELLGSITEPGVPLSSNVSIGTGLASWSSGISLILYM
jgi:hypothetical protein